MTPETLLYVLVAVAIALMVLVLILLRRLNNKFEAPKARRPGFWSRVWNR
jgi:hypothetical protein